MRRVGCETSATARAMMDGKHPPMRTWFVARRNGISALKLQAKLGIGSYKAAWLVLHKLSRRMVGPRHELEGTIEVDEIAHRTKEMIPSAAAKAAAVSATSFVAGPGIPDSSAQDFVKAATAENSIVLTDGLCRPIRANQFPAPAILVPCSVE